MVSNEQPNCIRGMPSTDEARVEIVPYDESWPARFEEERIVLAAALQPWIVGGIEHVGSTSVRNLAAKPVIDIMLGVDSLDASRPALTALASLGYMYLPYRGDVMHWLCKPSLALRTHHLHLVPFNSDLWVERLAFRDYLRAHPDTARAYAELKRSLAKQFEFDRETYTESKGPFVQEVLALARRGG